MKNDEEVEMRRVLINKCYGGFSLSNAALQWLYEREYPFGEYMYEPDPNSCVRIGWLAPNGLTISPYPNIPRDNALLLECFDALGKEFNGDCADIKAVEIPDDVAFEIEEYDGIEWVAESHRTWG